MPSELEENLYKAILSYREGRFLSIRAYATAFLVLVSTLLYRLSGRTSYSTTYVYRQILLTAKEESLIKWISRLSKAGYPITLPITRNLAK